MVCTVTRHDIPGTGTGRSARALCCAPATLAAVPSLRGFAGRVARLWGVPADVVDALSLVVSELVSNAVLHSGSPEVTLLLTLNDAGLSAEVADSGQWRHRTARRLASEDHDAVCGRGLDLVKAVSSWWRAVQTPAGSKVTAFLPLTEPAL